METLWRPLHILCELKDMSLISTKILMRSIEYEAVISRRPLTPHIPEASKSAETILRPFVIKELAVCRKAERTRYKCEDLYC